MKLSPSFTELANLVNQMGAELVSWKSGVDPLPPKKINVVDPQLAARGPGARKNQRRNVNRNSADFDRAERQGQKR